MSFNDEHKNISFIDLHHQLILWQRRKNQYDYSLFYDGKQYIVAFFYK